MSEEAPEEGTPETQDTGSPEDEAPANASPAFDWDSDENPYKQRYNDLRPEFDRRQSFIDSLNNPATLGQLLAQLDDETQAEALRRSGWDPGDEDQTDLDEPLTKAEWQAWQQAQQEQAQFAQQSEQALEADTEFTKSELNRLGISEDDPSLDLLLPLAFRFRDNEGKLGIEQAHQMLNGYAETSRKAYLQSKRAPQVATGSAGTESVDLTDDDVRRERMVADIASMMEAEAD